MKSESSNAYKGSGDKFSPSVVKKCHLITGATNAVAMYAVKPLIVIADPELTHADKSIYDSIKFLAWYSGTGKCQESLGMVGALCNATKRQAIRSAQKLCSRGYVLREKSGDRHTPDALIPVVRPELQKSVSHLPAVQGHCMHCHKSRKIGPSGICRVCINEAERMRAYRNAQRDLGPNATHSEIAAHLQADCADRKWLKVARKVARMAS